MVADTARIAQFRIEHQRRQPPDGQPVLVLITCLDVLQFRRRNRSLGKDPLIDATTRVDEAVALVARPRCRQQQTGQRIAVEIVVVAEILVGLRAVVEGLDLGAVDGKTEVDAVIFGDRIAKAQAGTRRRGLVARNGCGLGRVGGAVVGVPAKTDAIDREIRVGERQ